MDILQTTVRKRETYQVKLQTSILWECVLGIAAITNTPMLDSLEKPKESWQEMRGSLENNLKAQLDFVEKNNTWKTLLQLLHQKEFSDLHEFSTYIQELADEALRYHSLPYMGFQYESLRELASKGKQESITQLKELTKNNSFFPAYIEFICSVDTLELKKHLIEVMENWYVQVVEPKIAETTRILQTDYDSKQKMLQQMKPEELVQWATGGINYLPEPTVHTVLLIPQYTYRPWNIEADIEGTKVFYYPVANESITPHDPYTPSNFLVLTYKALGDEARLRIVKLLKEKERSLQELTEKLEIGKSTTHHHLKILRAAKLVEIKEAKYFLRESAIELLAKELESFLIIEDKVRNE